MNHECCMFYNGKKPLQNFVISNGNIKEGTDHDEKAHTSIEMPPLKE